MTSVGIIANPAAGKDIRRIVAQGRFVPNHEKVNILKRVLAGLDAVGVESVLMMPDSGGLGRSALAGMETGFSATFVQMPVFHDELDSTRAAGLMREAGVGCIITLGGDGTNRAVAKACGDVPIVPISTGTNNVFPMMLEGTIAGLAAAVVATRVRDLDRMVSRHTKLEIAVDGEPQDIALVDLAVSTDRFVGARAIWDMSTIHELFLTRAEPASIGLSAIGAQLRITAPDEPVGLHIGLGHGSTEVLAPVAPGLVRPVSIAEWHTIEVGGAGVAIKLRPATIALDGERTFNLRPGAQALVRLGEDGPRVVDPDRALALAAESGLMASASQGGG